MSGDTGDKGVTRTVRDGTGDEGLCVGVDRLCAAAETSHLPVSLMGDPSRPYASPIVEAPRALWMTRTMRATRTMRGDTDDEGLPVGVRCQVRRRYPVWHRYAVPSTACDVALGVRGRARHAVVCSAYDVVRGVWCCAQRVASCSACGVVLGVWKGWSLGVVSARSRVGAIWLLVLRVIQRVDGRRPNGGRETAGGLCFAETRWRARKGGACRRPVGRGERRTGKAYSGPALHRPQSRARFVSQ